jgi:hypothetical protein
MAGYLESFQRLEEGTQLGNAASNELGFKPYKFGTGGKLLRHVLANPPPSLISTGIEELSKKLGLVGRPP